MTPPTSAVRRGRRWGREAIAVAGLTAVWVLFWGDLSWANVLSGSALAAGILIVFPLPPVAFGGRPRPLAMLAFATTFARDVVMASMALGWLAVRPGASPRSAVVAVPLRLATDLNLALTAEVLSLVPGTLAVEVDRDAAILFVHVFDVRGPAHLARTRGRIRQMEAQLVRALGLSASDQNGDR